MEKKVNDCLSSELELFPKRSYTASKIQITISKNGVILLSSGCMCNYFNRNGCRYVLLYVNKNKQLIGIEPSQEKNKLTYSVQVNTPSRTGYIYARSILHYIGVDYRKGAQTYIPVWDEKQKRLIIQINS